MSESLPKIPLSRLFVITTWIAVAAWMLSQERLPPLRGIGFGILCYWVAMGILPLSKSRVRLVAWPSLCLGLVTFIAALHFTVKGVLFTAGACWQILRAYWAGAV